MTDETFWAIIEGCFAGGDRDEEVEAYEERLSDLAEEDVYAFQRVLNEVMLRAYRRELIGAACFLGCGQSDDGFEDFRAWLISLGRDEFERLLANPSLLAERDYDESPTEEWHCEELHMTPGEVGGEEDDEDWPYPETPDSPAGEAVSLTQAALKDRFPAMWERFGNQFMIGIPE